MATFFMLLITEQFLEYEKPIHNRSRHILWRYRVWSSAAACFILRENFSVFFLVYPHKFRNSVQITLRPFPSMTLRFIIHLTCSRYISPIMADPLNNDKKAYCIKLVTYVHFHCIDGAKSQLSPYIRSANPQFPHYINNLTSELYRYINSAKSEPYHYLNNEASEL
jgi:hypothetical protein